MAPRLLRIVPVRFGTRLCAFVLRAMLALAVHVTGARAAPPSAAQVTIARMQLRAFLARRDVVLPQHEDNPRVKTEWVSDAFWIRSLAPEFSASAGWERTGTLWDRRALDAANRYDRLPLAQHLSLEFVRVGQGGPRLQIAGMRDGSGQLIFPRPLVDLHELALFGIRDQADLDAHLAQTIRGLTVGQYTTSTPPADAEARAGVHAEMNTELAHQAARDRFRMGESFRGDMAVLAGLLRIGKRAPGSPSSIVLAERGKEKLVLTDPMGRDDFRLRLEGFDWMIRESSNRGTQRKRMQGWTSPDRAPQDAHLLHLGLRTEADIEAAIGRALTTYAPEDFE